ncbi:tryptophan synthase subunit alpha [Methanohalophilus portucalensis]|uniref:Tryptophan synthase alpha chain n=2 Tax=Methanohalophilus portucalensis TaxID=39664 RepID=A0A1L9C3T9_9EURY|nr:tryptophan synthase subunit alpha [Methanohalophilus portucalensis]ATU07963.1 tryptophan synthase subunit alpha [Methanohalophilus portucalensis]OJH49192.1 tryptophan synthase subunit alpha [Methanohalophilus portucalensis FDF-1]RNI11680.1 tryptophan synthase subunit alpha [Methanohalophilus portucalensis FDF-1]SMH42615.1 tryptophan synthase, alpha chain [Methanohalophilus portucalensis FDF-1]
MRISQKFEELKDKNEKALIAYVCAGDPDTETTPSIVNALVEAGADIIELGLPFSDPVADGPTIQAATCRAIEAGMNTDRYFEMIKDLEVNVPLICMTYYNLIYRQGSKNFVKKCAEAGISGLIIPDLPLHEADELIEICKEEGIDNIFLVAPNTSDQRLDAISSKSSGFIYVVSKLGVTGEGKNISSNVAGLLDKINSNLPKAVGFGISNRKHVEEMVAAGADAVIVGSAFVNIIASKDNVISRLKEITKDLKEGCR